MKKLLFLLGGVLTLTACTSDSVLDEIDQQNNEMNAPPTFDDKSPGDLGTGGISNLATNYFSPWDLGWNRLGKYRDLQPSYVISNGDEDDNYSPYRLEVHAWIGLAYFDGTNDGVFNDHFTGSAFTLNLANYPNLFANGEEVGNLVKTTILTPFRPQESARIEDRVHHLPMPGSTTARYPSTTPPWAFGLWKDGFDDMGTLQQPEIDLLRDYGKVFFYEVDVFEDATNAFVGTYILHPEIQTLPQGSVKNWYKVPDLLGTAQLQGNLPFGSFNLHYYTNNPTNSLPHQPTKYTNGLGDPVACNSYELVFDTAGIINHQQTITGSVPKTLTMDIWQDAPTFWQRSALHLRVH